MHPLDRPSRRRPPQQARFLKSRSTPDSLGAQVLLSASAFVDRLGNQAMHALDTVQSLPLLYGWMVMVVTNPLARDILVDVSWRVALVLAVAAAAEYGFRRAMQRPIRSLEGLAPRLRPPASAETALLTDSDEDNDVVQDDDAVVGASGEAQAVAPTEAVVPRRPRPSAWTLLKRVPLVLARLVLELIPVLGILLVGHLIAGSSLGGQTIRPADHSGDRRRLRRLRRVVVPRADAAVA